MNRSLTIALTMLLVAGVAGVADPVAAKDEERAPTAEERERVLKALEALGYKEPKEIEIEGRYIEVEDALHTDGKRYELKLDPKTLKVLKRKVEKD